MKFITEEEFIKLSQDSSSYRDATIELNNLFEQRVFELIDDDAMLILTEISPETNRALRAYIIDKLGGKI